MHFICGGSGDQEHPQQALAGITDQGASETGTKASTGRVLTGSVRGGSVGEVKNCSLLFLCLLGEHTITCLRLGSDTTCKIRPVS